MRYKVSNNLLKLREFGRNVQMLVEAAKVMEDDDMRNALVHDIVRIMSNINPGVKDRPDYKQKLWDHMYYLAEFNIKVDSEYGMPDPEVVLSRPKVPMAYHDARPSFRQYGRNVDLMLDRAMDLEDEERRFELVNLIANIMRMHLKYDKRESNVELTVVEHIKTLTRGKIVVLPEQLKWYKIAPPPPAPTHTHSKSKKKKKSRRY